MLSDKLVIGIDEVFDAKIPFDAKNFSESEIILAFNFLFSNTASIIKSQSTS